MTALLTNPRPIPAVVAPCDAGSLSTTSLEIGAAGPSLGVEGTQAKGHRMPFAYCPGPASVILLKIRAMENYSANAGRLIRQRLFCSRVKCP